MILKILSNNHDRLLHRRLLRMNMNLRILRSLIRRADTCELLDLTRHGFLVQALGISLCGFFDWDVDEYFDEGEGRVGVFGVGVELASDLVVGFVG